MNPGNDHPNDNGAPNPEQNDNNPPHEGEMNQVDNNDSIDSEASSGSELDYPTEQRILTSPVALRTSQECGGNARPITNSDLQKALAKCSTNRNPILNEMPDRDDLGATGINQAGSSGANQPGPAEEDQPGHSRNPSTVFMESGMSNFRHSALAEVLERRFGFIAQRIRENTQRLVDDPVTRPIVPMVLSPLVELGLYQIVFPHAEGPPYFYIWENSEKNETTPSQAQSAGEKKKFNPQDVDLTEIGHAEHLPQEVDEWGRLIIPLDFSEDSYVNKLGGLPLDIPPRSDITVDPRSCGPTDMQKKNPMLSNMLGLDKKPKKLVVNDPILTAMLSGPPPSWDYLISLVGTLHLEREIAMTKLRRLLLIEGYIYVRKMDPELASEWAEMDDLMYNELEQPELAMQRLHILQEVIEILKDRPALMYLWCTFDPTEEFLEVPLEKVDYSKKQIPVRPVEIAVYNVTTNTKGTVQGKPSPPPSRDSSPDRQGSTEQEQDTAEEKVEDEEQEGPGTSRQNKDQQGSSDEKMDTAEDDEDDQEQEQVSAPRNEPSLDNQQPPLDNQQPQENQPIQQNVATQQNEGAQGNEPEDDNANGQIISTGAPRQPERLDEMSAKVYGKPISITDLQDALAMIYPPSPPSHQHDSNLPTLSLTLDETPMRVASGPCGKIGKRNREMRDIIRFLTQQRDNATATQNNGNPTGTGTTSRLRDTHPITAAILGKPPLPPRNRTRGRPPSSDAPGSLECPHSPAKQRRLNPTSCNLQGHQRTATLGNLQVQVGSVDNVPPPGATRVNTPSKQPCRLDHRMHQGTQQSSASSTQGTQQSTAGSTQAQRDEPTDQGNRQPNQPTPHASEEVRKKLAETLKEKKEEEDEEEESPEHQPGPSEGQQGQAQTTGLQMGGQQGIRTRTLENYLEWREDVPQFSPFHVCHRARIIEIPQRRTPVRAPQDQQVLFQFRNPQVQQRPLQFRNPLTAPRPPQNINLQEQPQLAQFHPLLAQHLQRAPLPQGQAQVPQQENVQQNQPQEAEDANAENPQPQNQED